VVPQKPRHRAAIATLWLTSCLILACAKKPPINQFQLEGSRLIVNNTTSDPWKDVEIKINRQYRVVVPEILAGQRLDVQLDAFLDVYGNHFRYARQQIKDVHLTGAANGKPLDLTMEFPRSGLDGLSDAMKKENK
jgi:hypothetical protein